MRPSASASLRVIGLARIRGERHCFVDNGLDFVERRLSDGPAHGVYEHIAQSRQPIDRIIRA